MKVKSGTVGWVAVTACVVGWDYGVALRGQGETLSSAFRRASRHPLSRWPVTLAWTITTLHLYGVLPPRMDPFVIAANRCAPRKMLQG